MKPWLTIIGVGGAGVDDLSTRAKNVIKHAEAVAGTKFHLDQVEINGQKIYFPERKVAVFEEIDKWRGKQTVLLTQGDPFFYGIGKIILDRYNSQEIYSIPAPSAFSLVASRMKWQQQDCKLLSLYDRPFDVFVTHLIPGTKIISLCRDENTPRMVAEYLSNNNMGKSIIYVLEGIDTPRERIRWTLAEEYNFNDVISFLNSLALDIR
jgi:precorrin-6Y C5,15-methyltransferase (decarboxylating)